MHIIDSHFHWRPRSVLEKLCARKTYPRAEPNPRGGYTYWREEGGRRLSNVGAEWFELDRQLAFMDTLGHEVSVISSIGPFSFVFSDLPPEEGRDLAMMWNEEMARVQREHAGRFWGTAAVPLIDTRIAIEVLDHAIGELGLVGVNLPGSFAHGSRIDAERLEPFYDRVEELGATIFLHPTDGLFEESLEGYGGALYLSLGRVVDLSVSAMRLVFSGIMERHKDLKIFMSHTGGALPYQSGRMDKNGKAAKLPLPPSAYIRRMYTDIVSPHAVGMKFAIEYYGIDHVLYGTDYPCWDPKAALKFFDEIGLSQADQEKIFAGNARRIFGLGAPARPATREPAPELVAAK